MTAHDDLTQLGSHDEPAATRAKLPPGHVLGPFRIVRELGSGGMGDVYEAEEIETGRRIALKTLSRAMDSELRERFLREGRLAASISHPNSVYVYGSYEIDGIAAITMELVGGGTLEALVDARGPMTPAEAVEAILQIIAGLEAAQARAILHRDIKPSNCFIDTNGIVKVGDYGLSLSIKTADDTRLTTAGMFLGTPAYASPEQIRGLPVDVRSDIYSVGATMYFLLTGRSPFEQPNTMQMLAAVLTESPVSPRTHAPDVSDALAEVVLRCLRKDPSTRPASYAALRQALQVFSPKTARPARRTRRVRAALVDWLLLVPVRMALAAAVGSASAGPLVRMAVDWLVYVTYFGWLEGRYSASLGKRLFGLRVVAADGTPAGLARAGVRAAAWSLILVAPALVDVAVPSVDLAGGTQWAVSLIVMFAGARRRNGDLGTHELASATRTVAAATAWQGSQQRDKTTVATRGIEATSDRVGGYAVRHRVWERDDEALDLAWDTTLDRGVWIHHRKPGTAALPEARRTLARRTRLRWLASRRADDEAWDAFEAPDGSPLGHLPPGTTVSLLDELATECQSALADNTAISPISVDQVWATADGSVRLAEFPVVAGTSSSTRRVSDLPSAQTFLHDVAVRALGGALAAVALPLSQRAAIDKLGRGEFKSFGDIADGLLAVRGLPSQVSTARRRASLTGGFLMCVLLLGMGVSEITAAFALRARPDVDEAGRAFVRLLALEEPDEAEGTQWISRNPSSRYTAEEREAFKVYAGTRYAGIIADDTAWDLIDRNFEGGDDLPRVARSARDAATTASVEVRERAESGAFRVLDDLARRKTESGGFWLSLFYRLQTMVARGLGNVAPFALFWALVFRGSPILGLLNLGIAGPDGRRASWWRARWRSVLAWAPALGGFFALLWFERVDVHLAAVQSVIGVTNAVMVAGFILTALKPECAIQDRLARTRIVPV